MAFFTLRIEMDNAAFHDDKYGGEDYAYITELRRLLTLVTTQACDETLTYGDLRDNNGNRCGAWGIIDRAKYQPA